MNKRISTVTRKGQITIPVEMRRALSLHEEDAVTLKRASMGVVARTSGIIKADVPKLSAEEERRAAEEAIAGAAVVRMGG